LKWWLILILLTFSNRVLNSVSCFILISHSKILFNASFLSDSTDSIQKTEWVINSWNMDLSILAYKHLLLSMNIIFKSSSMAMEDSCPSLACFWPLKGMLQEFWKIDMFLETFRLLACAISNFVWSPYKDFPTFDLGTW